MPKIVKTSPCPHPLHPVRHVPHYKRHKRITGTRGDGHLGRVRRCSARSTACSPKILYTVPDA